MPGFKEALPPQEFGENDEITLDLDEELKKAEAATREQELQRARFGNFSEDLQWKAEAAGQLFEEAQRIKKEKEAAGQALEELEKADGTAA